MSNVAGLIESLATDGIQLFVTAEGALRYRATRPLTTEEKEKVSGSKAELIAVLQAHREPPDGRRRYPYSCRDCFHASAGCQRPERREFGLQCRHDCSEFLKKGQI